MSDQSQNQTLTDEEGNPMRWAKKPWNHIGLYTREDAVKLLCDRMVSQKRRMLMKDCVRIIYYCQVQRSSGCRYEMSVCVPLNPKEMVRIDDFKSHTCDVSVNRLRRRALPQLEDFDRPIEKRVRGVSRLTKGVEGTEEGYDEQDDIMAHIEQISADNSLHSLISNAIPGPSELSHLNDFPVWTTVDVDVVDMTKKPDGPFNFVLNCADQASRFSYAYPIVNNQSDVVAKALLDMMYIFGPPEALHLDASYQNTPLSGVLHNRFPSVNLTYFSSKRNHIGQLVPRREAQQVKDRLFAWMVENGSAGWVQELCAMKFAHNSEWIEELGSTPMDLFYKRNRRAVYQDDCVLQESSLQPISNELKLEDVKVELASV